MATLNKNFKVKNGLIVEGTVAKVNGNQILTETASDTYILNLIGGETLIKSVDTGTFAVDGAGNLTVNAEVFDAFGDAEYALTTANSYTDGEITTALSTASGYADAVAGDLSDHEALSAGVHGVTGSVVGTTDTQDLSNKRIIDTLHFSDGVTVNDEAQIEVFAGSHVFNIQANDGDLNLKAAAAGASVYVISDDADIVLAAHGESYLGSVAAGNIIATVGYADSVAAAAQTAAEGFATQAIADLVDSAPATLDTLNELAAALQDNPDIISDLQDIASGKQDTLTAGSNIDITGATISVTGLDTDDVSEGTNLYFTDARALTATAFAYDAAGAAATAETNANSYTDTAIGNLDTDAIEEGFINEYFTDARAKLSAAALLTGASLTNITITGDSTGLIITAENGVADSTTDDLVEGETNLYFSNARALGAVDGSDITPNLVEIGQFRKEEATQQYVSSASTVNVHSLSGSYESAKYLVRVVGNVSGARHSQLTEILLTTDGGGNIAITEYGNIHTSDDPLASFSATVVGGYATLTATTAVVNTEIIAAATMLSWAD